MKEKQSYEKNATNHGISNILDIDSSVPVSLMIYLFRLPFI